MRLLILFSLLSIGLAHANTSYAQKAVISLNVKNETVQEVLDEIEEKSEFTFFFNHKHLDLNRNVSISAHQSNVFDILERVFEGTDVNYSVLDKKIILSTEVSPISQQDKGIITGTVVDVNGETIVGATIQLKGTTTGVVTDIDGAFSIKAEASDVLIISFIGYIAQEITVGSNKVLSIQLEEDIEALEEVVVVGYAVQKKANLTGAVSSISADELESRPMSNLGQGLQGLVPNVNISIPANGNPGQGSSFNIRGTTSLAGGSPLVLIDGVQMDPNLINPQDVATMSFLKDAASASIYGARAAFGVILITTKKGKNSAPRISYSNNLAFNSPTFIPEPQNSVEWAETLNRGFTNLGNNPYVSETWLKHIKAYAADPVNAPNWYADPNGKVNAGGGAFNYCADTDLIDEYYKTSAFMQQHTASIQGGSDKFTYYASLGFYEHNGFLKYTSDTYDRFNIKLNMSSQITEWLKIGVNSNRPKNYILPNT